MRYINSRFTLLYFTLALSVNVIQGRRLAHRSFLFCKFQEICRSFLYKFLARLSPEKYVDLNSIMQNGATEWHGK